MKVSVYMTAATLALVLSGCSAPAPTSSEAVSSAPAASEAMSSLLEVSESVSSREEPTVSEQTTSSEAPISSEAPVPFEAPVSSEASASSADLTLPPVESEKIPELACPLAGSQAEAPASSQTQSPASSEAVSSAPPASSTVSEYIVPEDERPMTEAEVDALIAEAIAYAESKGMTWREDYSLSNEIQGYNPPGHSEWGYRACKETVLFNIEQLCRVADEDTYWQEGMEIWYKIEKGQIDPFEGWFIYVLY